MLSCGSVAASAFPLGGERLAFARGRTLRPVPGSRLGHPEVAGAGSAFVPRKRTRALGSGQESVALEARGHCGGPVLGLGQSSAASLLSILYTLVTASPSPRSPASRFLLPLDLSCELGYPGGTGAQVSCLM